MIIVTYKSSEFKCWVAFYTDDEGNQIGDCSYGYNRRSAIEELEFSFKSKESK